jgi:hypothetical protein
MRLKSTVGMVGSMLLLAACTQEPPLYVGPQYALFDLASNVEAINSPAYAVRPPLPGRPGYLDTIRYIDDGVRYIDPYAEFFISFDGQMCFRGLVNQQHAEFEYYQNYWCMYPTNVNNIDALENDVSYVNVVRLWCKRAAPQCARKYGFSNYLDETNLLGNGISAQTVAYKQERDAIEYLIYLMGGSVERSTSLQR